MIQSPQLDGQGIREANNKEGGAAAGKRTKDRDSPIGASYVTGPAPSVTIPAISVTAPARRVTQPVLTIRGQAAA